MVEQRLFSDFLGTCKSGPILTVLLHSRIYDIHAGNRRSTQYASSSTDHHEASDTAQTQGPATRQPPATPGLDYPVFELGASGAAAYCYAEPIMPAAQVHTKPVGCSTFLEQRLFSGVEDLPRLAR